MTRLFTRAAIGALFAAVVFTAPAFAQDVTVGSLTLSNLWARATPPKAPTGAGYLTITNNGSAADTLTAVSTPAAEIGELHIMEVKDGIMTMHPVEGGIPIPAGGTVTLQPGGYHLMFVKLKHDLKQGEELPVTLTFAKAGTVEAELPIMPVGSKGPAGAGGGKMNMDDGKMGTGQMTGLRAIRVIVWVAVAVLLGTAGGLYFLGQFGGGTPKVVASQIGGPFTLTDQNGNTVTEAALQGHPSALYFGYTYCPDVCPTTLADLTQWMGDLGPDADKIKVYFITVDPERDTQEAMASYMQAFDPRFTALTGTRPQIDQVIKEYRIYSRKVPGDDGSYTMDHTATVFLLNAKAELVSTIDYQEETDKALAKLKRVIGTS